MEISYTLKTSRIIQKKHLFLLLPQLVFDKDKNRWVDKDAGPEDTPAPPPPPPTGGFGGKMTAPRKTPSAGTPAGSAAIAPMAPPQPRQGPSAFQQQPHKPSDQPPSMPPPASFTEVSAPPHPIETRSEMPPSQAAPIPAQTDALSSTAPPNNAPPPAEPAVQSMRGANAARRAARRTLLEQSKAAAAQKQKDEEEKKKPTGPPSMFSMKAQGGRRGNHLLFVCFHFSI